MKPIEQGGYGVHSMWPTFENLRCGNCSDQLYCDLWNEVDDFLADFGILASEK